jgi:VWFA-related protein
MFARNLSKHFSRALLFVFSITVLSMVFSITASAQPWNKKTTVTFSGPVEIPGVGAQVLPAGTYVFRLLDSTSDRNIVQIFNKDQSHIYATILAIPNYRLKDNASHRHLNDVFQIAQQSSATIYTIGIYENTNADRNPRVLRNIARSSGGRAYFPGSLNDLKQVWRDIAGAIRSQYTIGYYSSNPNRDGMFRKVKITAGRNGGRDLRVTTRDTHAAVTDRGKISDDAPRVGRPDHGDDGRTGRRRELL